MQKAILINAEYSINLSGDENADSDNVPLGLVSIGTVIQQKGYEPIVIDCRMQKGWKKELKELLHKKDVLALGISAMAIQTKSVVEISKFVREQDPKVPIVLGGAHPTCFPIETCKSELVDFVVKGEGEYTFLELLDYLKYKKENKLTEEDYEKLSKINGLTYKKEGEVVSNPDRRYCNFQELPMPNWHILDPKVISRIKYAPVHSGRGCSHRCAFCINRIYKNYWRSKRPEQVLEELEMSMKIFKTKKIIFWDENFFQNPSRAKEILNEIVKREMNITWSSNIRANYFTNGFIDDDYLDLIKKAGCEYVATGAESGSQRILDKIQKDMKVKDLIEECKMLTRHNIRPQYSFMIGIPGETKKDMLLTVKLIDKLVKINPNIDLLGPQKFRPYPGGDLYNEVVEAGWKSPSSLEEWAEIMDENWNYLPAKSFPWIKDPDFVESLEVYVSFGARSVKNSLKTSVKVNKVLLIMFIIASKIRWKLKFFNFPIEYKLAQRVIQWRNHKAVKAEA